MVHGVKLNANLYVMQQNLTVYINAEIIQLIFKVLPAQTLQTWQYQNKTYRANCLNTCESCNMKERLL